MKPMFVLLLVLVVALAADDHSKRDALQNLQDQTSGQIQTLTAENNELNVQVARLSAGGPAPSPSWIQQRINQRPTALDPPP